MSHFVTVLIADNNEQFRQTLLQALVVAQGIHVVGLTDTVQEAVALTRVLLPDVILLNAALLDDERAPEADAELFETSKVLTLSEPGQEARTLQTLQLGARGFLVKGDELLTKLADAIRAVQRGEAILSPRLTGWMLDTILH